jgi:hypothetical protein
MMKKILAILAVVIGANFSINAQNNTVIIQQNSQTNKPKEREVIVVKESVVRGIEMEVIDKDNVIITNYNNFKVECEYEIKFSILSKLSYAGYYDWITHTDWSINNKKSEIQSGKKVLLPNQPFKLKRKETIPEENRYNSGGWSWKEEFSKGNAFIISVKNYKF